MLQLDRNQHTPTFSPPLISDKDQSQILPLSVHKDKLQSFETSPASTLTPPPEQHSSPTTNAPPAAAALESAVDNASRQSTPLSELSSPSHGGDSPVAEEVEAEDNTEIGRAQNGTDEGAGDESTPLENTKPSIQPEALSVQKEPTPAFEISASNPPESVTTNLSPSISSPPSTSSPTASQSSSVLDTKVVTILELNAELLKAAFELQSRGITTTDTSFNQLSTRMQSNLAWMAAAADANRESMTMALPVMQAPTGVDSMSMGRIYQLYATLPTIFANDVIRRNQSEGSPATARSVSPSISLKRDRTEEAPVDLVHKRRDTGESKMGMTPPSLLSHQAPFPSITPSISPPAAIYQGHPPSNSMPPPSQIPSMSPPAPDPRRQNQAMRPPPPQHLSQPNIQQLPTQISPSNSSHSGITGSMPPNISGPPQSPSNGTTPQAAALNSLGPMANQYYQILQNPSHPMVQYLINSIPGFQSLPLNVQIGKLHQMQSALQSRNQQQIAAQRIGQQGGGQQMNANLNSGPQQPTSNQSPVNAQSFSYPGGNPAMDQRTNMQTMSNSNPQAGIPNINSLTANQRTLLMMQQQMRTNGMNTGMNNGSVNPAMLNSQIAAAQERMRQEQRIPPSAGSPPHSQQSPMGNGSDGNQFPMMRSNSTLPGIARSGRSPTDGAPMQGRIPSGSQPTAEDMQRALFAQQQRNMMAAQNNTPGYVNPQQMFNGGGNSWGQQQQHGGMGGQQQQQQGYGMSPPPSAGGQGGGGYGSPNPQQQWGQGGGLPSDMQQYSYNAVSSPAGDRTSATPTPSQQMSHSPSGTMDPSQSLGDFDLFNWAQ